MLCTVKFNTEEEKTVLSLSLQDPKYNQKEKLGTSENYRSRQSTQSLTTLQIRPNSEVNK